MRPLHNHHLQMSLELCQHRAYVPLRKLALGWAPVQLALFSASLAIELVQVEVVQSF